MLAKPDEEILLEVLEAVYWDTVIPLAAQLRDAGVDLLSLRIDPDQASYWEPYAAYTSLNSQR
jgi:hypothetical protein